MHQLPAPVSSTGQALAPPLPDIARLPLWQRRILAYLQAGLSLKAAVAQLHDDGISPDIMNRWAAEGTPFRTAIALVESGVVLMGVDEARRLAIARASRLVEHFGAQATDPAVRPRDQQGAGRLTLEVGGLVGRPPPDTTAREAAHAVLAELERAMREAAQRSGPVVDAATIEVNPPLISPPEEA